MTTKTIWLCGNTLCSHRASKRWHAVMAERIEQTVGPAEVLNFETAHPDPDLMECDDCYQVGSHDWSVEH
jgi:hypothetical protein